MSEASKGGGAFAKVVQKTFVRTKTKVLQRVGKADKTKDEVYKDNIAAFQRQQAVAMRLHKETKHYIACVKAMSAAAKSLYTVLKETYEEDWYDPQTLCGSLNSLELMHTNYEAELTERVYADLNDYLDKFPVYKERMNKRNRKLLDYDNARQAYDSLYTAKKPDHTKISKAHEAMEDSKYLYEEINMELHKELPKFYENRVEIIANNLIKLFNAEATFHTNTGKINDKLVEQLQTLASTHTDEMERLRNLPPKNTAETSYSAEDHEALDLSSLSAGLSSPTKSNGHRGDVGTPRMHQHSRTSRPISDSPDTEVRKPPPARPTAAPQSPSSSSYGEGNPFAADDEDETPENTPALVTSVGGADDTSTGGADVTSTGGTDVTSTGGTDVPCGDNHKPAVVPDVQESLGDSSTVPTADSVSETGGNPFEDDDDEEELVEDKPKSAEDETPVGPPVVVEAVAAVSSPPMQSNASNSESKPSTSSLSSVAVLYQVMATHPYTAEDEDELSFDAGQIINVVEYDNEEEQDDGWLMGVNTVTESKGVFPANFTQRIARKT